jgi:uncharacterized protein
VTSIRERLQADLPAAMKARDAATVSVLRTTLAALSNAEAVEQGDAGALGTRGVYSSEAARRELSSDDERTVVQREIEELLASAEESEDAGQTDEAEILRGKAEVLTRYLDI